MLYPYTGHKEEVGQLVGKHDGKFAHISSFMHGLLRSEHLCDMKKYGKCLEFRKTSVSGYNTSREQYDSYLLLRSIL